MLWQTPPLAVAAQSFLLSTAFKSDTQATTSLVFSTTSVIVATASILLMIKHRGYEITDSHALRDFEWKNKNQGYSVIHGPREASGIARFIKAFRIWISVLFLFLFLALFGVISGFQKLNASEGNAALTSETPQTPASPPPALPNSPPAPTPKHPSSAPDRSPHHPTAAPWRNRGSPHPHTSAAPAP